MDESEFLALVRTNPVNDAILDRLRSLALPDAWLVSGCLFQTVWNHRTGRAPEHGIKDYDVLYFDPDLSKLAEDRVIAACADAFADLGADIEVRNQARVHLWYPDWFGTAYPPLTCAIDGIDRFLAQVCMVGIKPRTDALDVYAPHGFADVAGMIVRPNRAPNFQAAEYDKKAARWRQTWPEITVLPADGV